MTRQSLGIGGAIGAILSLFLPFERHYRLIPSTFNVSEFTEFESSSLIGYSPFFAVLVAASALSSGVLLYLKDEDKSKLAVWALCAAVGATVLYNFYVIGMNNAGRSNFAIWGWIGLIASAACCFVSSLGDSTEKIADLSWPTSKPKIRTAYASSSHTDPMELAQAIGGNVLTFAFCCGLPFLGYFLWKYMEKEDSPYCNTAFIGWILGFIFYIGRFAWRFIQVGSSLN